MIKGMTKDDAISVAASMAAAAVAASLVFLLARRVFGPDYGMLFGTILGSYAGVAVPFFIVRSRGGTPADAATQTTAQA